MLEAHLPDHAARQAVMLERQRAHLGRQVVAAAGGAVTVLTPQLDEQLAQPPIIVEAHEQVG